MLRAVILIKKNVDISKYVHLIGFLRKKAVGYKPTKSKVLTKQDVTKFLLNAENDIYLLMKVAMIIGLGGACRREELTNLLLDDVKDEGQFFRFVISNKKTKNYREFFITSGDIEGLNLVEVIRNYIRLRPVGTDHNRFFVGYRNGKCTRQPVGINTFGSMAKKIASFLNLSNPEKYTGHCFRRSSKSSLAGSGADLFIVKRFGGWKPNAVLEGCSEASVESNWIGTLSGPR